MIGKVNKPMGVSASMAGISKAKQSLAAAKSMDPKSIVRSGEYNMMAKAKNLQNRTASMKAKIKGGRPVPKGGGIGAGIASVAKSLRDKVNRGRTISYQRNKGQQGALKSGKKKMMSSDGTMYQ